MFLYDQLPIEARGTYHYDLRAQVFMGVRFGVVELAALVAKKSLEAPDWQLAVITGAPVAALALSFVWARIAASSRKMPVVVVPQLISHVLIGLTAFATGSLSFVILYCAAVMVFCVSMPASSAIYRLNYPPTHRATIVGFTRALMFVISTLTSGVAGLVLKGDARVAGFLGGLAESGWLMGPGAYRSLFLAAAISGAFATLFFGRIKVKGEDRDAVRSEDPGFGQALRIVRSDSAFRLFLISYFVGGFANIMCMPLLPKIMVEELDLTYERAAIIQSTLPGLLMAMTSVFWGRVLDRVNPINARGWINLAWAISPLLVFAGAAMGSATPLYVSRALHGALLSGGNIIWHLGVNYFASREDLPIYQGIHMTSTGIRGMIAPFAGVGLAHWSLSVLGPGIGGPRFVYLVAAVMLLISGAIQFLLARRLRSQGRMGAFADAEAAADGCGSSDTTGD